MEENLMRIAILNGLHECTSADACMAGFAGSRSGVRRFDDYSTHQHNDLEELFDWQPHVTFVYTEVEWNVNTHKMEDVSEFMDNLLRILDKTDGGVVIKTVLSVDMVERVLKLNPRRVVYNPDVILERSLVRDYLEPTHILLGGSAEATQAVHGIYINYSNYSPMQIQMASGVEVAFAHQAMSAFHIMKNAFFNQLQYEVDTFGGSSTRVERMLASSPYIGKREKVMNEVWSKGVEGDHVTNMKFLEAFTSGQFTMLPECDRINKQYTTIRETFEV